MVTSSACHHLSSDVVVHAVRSECHIGCSAEIWTASLAGTVIVQATAGDYFLKCEGRSCSICNSKLCRQGLTHRIRTSRRDKKAGCNGWLCRRTGRAKGGNGPINPILVNSM